MNGHRPPWDPALAARLEGAVVLVGITHDGPSGPRHQQFFGTVEYADADKGVRLRLEGRRAGEMYTLPPDLRAFFPAEPGSYRLHETDEVVIDPDYTARWTITPPKN